MEKQVNMWMCGRNGRKRRICSGYRVAITKKDDAIQIATIQSILGIKARRVLKTLPNVNNIPGDLTERTVECILTALEVPRKNTT